MTEQDVFTSNKPGMLLGNIAPQKLIIADLVEIDMKDGSLTYLEGYAPDKAASAFWEAMSNEYRKMLRYKEATTELKQRVQAYRIEVDPSALQSQRLIDDLWRHIEHPEKV